MKTTLNRVLASILLLMTMMTAPTYADACGQDICLGPCNYEELLYDTKFNADPVTCPKWIWSGSAQRQKLTNPTNWVAKLYGSGDVTQTVSTGSYSAMDVAFQVTISSTTPGTERLYVEILRGSTVIETVAVIYPNATQTDYSMSIGNYSNDNIKMRFRYGVGAAPGNTIYRVDNATMFGGY